MCAEVKLLIIGLLRLLQLVSSQCGLTYTDTYGTKYISDPQALEVSWCMSCVSVNGMYCFVNSRCYYPGTVGENFEVSYPSKDYPTMICYDNVKNMSGCRLRLSKFLEYAPYCYTTPYPSTTYHVDAKSYDSKNRNLYLCSICVARGAMWCVDGYCGALALPPFNVDNPVMAPCSSSRITSYDKCLSFYTPTVPTTTTTTTTTTEVTTTTTTPFTPLPTTTVTYKPTALPPDYYKPTSTYQSQQAYSVCSLSFAMLACLRENSEGWCMDSQDCGSSVIISPPYVNHYSSYLLCVNSERLMPNIMYEVEKIEGNYAKCDIYGKVLRESSSMFSRCARCVAMGWTWGSEGICTGIPGYNSIASPVGSILIDLLACYRYHGPADSALPYMRGDYVYSPDLSGQQYSGRYYSYEGLNSSLSTLSACIRCENYTGEFWSLESMSCGSRLYLHSDYPRADALPKIGYIINLPLSYQSMESASCYKFFGYQVNLTNAYYIPNWGGYLVRDESYSTRCLRCVEFGSKWCSVGYCVSGGYYAHGSAATPSACASGITASSPPECVSIYPIDLQGFVSETVKGSTSTTTTTTTKTNPSPSSSSSSTTYRTSTAFSSPSVNSPSPLNNQSTTTSPSDSMISFGSLGPNAYIVIVVFVACIVAPCLCVSVMCLLVLRRISSKLGSREIPLQAFAARVPGEPITGAPIGGPSDRGGRV